MAKCFQNWELSSGENLLSTKMAGGCAHAHHTLLSAPLQLQLDQTGVSFGLAPAKTQLGQGTWDVRLQICQTILKLQFLQNFAWTEPGHPVIIEHQ